MNRYVAFLRAINVGGHTVRMERLRELFESMKLNAVETFIASGNVIFESRASQAGELERKIETTLNKALGYDVATFVRTIPELVQIAEHQPVMASGPVLASDVLYVTFVRRAPPAAFIPKLMEHRSDVDDFAVHEREIYWRCRIRSSDSSFSGARLEKLLGAPATARNVNTVQRIVAKYAG
jgi:uncharacterized protein (DUF1697 family)